MIQIIKEKKNHEHIQIYCNVLYEIKFTQSSKTLFFKVTNLISLSYKHINFIASTCNSWLWHKVYLLEIYDFPTKCKEDKQSRTSCWCD